jgi:hypothetical protein
MFENRCMHILSLYLILTLQLKSEKLGHSGRLHTFDITEKKVLSAKEYFREWKSSYDIAARNEFEKWPSNVRFGHMNFCDHKFIDKFIGYYDSIYLDMATTDLALVSFKIHSF